jgi:hypothetical protein
MRCVVIGAACLLAACAPSKPKAPAVDPFAVTRDDSCYTVDLFTKVAIRAPSDKVPSDWRGYSGRWGGGKWAGVWCHDLYVVDIAPDGKVTVIETHAPLEAWGKPATAFRRTARIGQDGRLRLAYGDVAVEYWLENGLLKGLRDEGAGLQHIAMTRRGT